MMQNSTIRRSFPSLSGLAIASILLGYVPAYAELVFPSSRVTSSLKVRSAPSTALDRTGKSQHPFHQRAGCQSWALTQGY